MPFNINSLKYNCFILLITFLLFVKISCGKQCMEKVCRNCPTTAVSMAGRPVDCRYNSLHAQLSALEVLQDQQKIVNVEDAEYACINLKASISSWKRVDSIDLLKACVVKQYAEEVCSKLVEEEEMRGNGNTKCTVCEDDLCNGTQKKYPLNIGLVFSILTLVYIWF